MPGQRINICSEKQNIAQNNGMHKINTTCSKAVVDWKLLVHIQEHCRTVQTMGLPPIYNSWGQQTVL